MDLTIEHRPLDALIPFARNAHTHSPQQIAQIAGSLREFGWTNPILVDGENGVIAGHGRLLAARQLGLTEVPVIELAHLTPTQKRAYILADNRLAESAGWDQELLALELAELKDADFDLALTGFDAGELEKLLDNVDSDEKLQETEETPAHDAADEVPEAPTVPVSRTGDCWQLGQHRLICGDAADVELIAALMQGEQAALCLTSPPYGNQRNYQNAIIDWDALMQGVFAQLPLTANGQVLVNLGLIHRDNEVVPYWDDWIAWMRAHGWRRFAWYVWDQGAGLPGDWNGRLAPRFEFIFHFNRQDSAVRRPNKTIPCRYAGDNRHLRSDGTSGNFREPDGRKSDWTHVGQPIQDFRIPDSVIGIHRQRRRIGAEIDHPAVFPVALPQYLIDAYTDQGEIVFDPFCGSGTTILAAERTQRRCTAVEIAPAYVDVAVKRFQQNHPEVEVTLAGTGQSFEAVAAERQPERRDTR